MIKAFNYHTLSLSLSLSWKLLDMNAILLTGPLNLSLTNQPTCLHTQYLVNDNRRSGVKSTSAVPYYVVSLKALNTGTLFRFLVQIGKTTTSTTVTNGGQAGTRT